MPRHKLNCLIIATLFVVHLPLRAQEARSTILGRITDPSGSLIVGATVEATNTDTGVRSTAQTNGNGDFLLPFLIPGPYSLAVEAPGFKKSVRPQIQVRVDQHITIDMALEIGQATESVQVKAETPLLDTSTTSRGQEPSSKAVLHLPL